MGTKLTQRETEVLAVVFSEMKEPPQVDFDIVAQKLNISYARNARSAFKRVWDKLTAADGKIIAPDDDEEVGTPKKKGRAAASKTDAKATATDDGEADDEMMEDEKPKAQAKGTAKRKPLPSTGSSFDADDENEQGPRKKGKTPAKRTTRAATIKAEEDNTGDSEAPPKKRARAAPKKVAAEAGPANPKVEATSEMSFKTQENNEAEGSGLKQDVQDSDEEASAAMFGITVEEYRVLSAKAPTPGPAEESDIEV